MGGLGFIAGKAKGAATIPYCPRVLASQTGIEMANSKIEEAALLLEAAQDDLRGAIEIIRECDASDEAQADFEAEVNRREGFADARVAGRKPGDYTRALQEGRLLPTGRPSDSTARLQMQQRGR